VQFVVNILGSITVGLCALLLLRAYARVRQRLLLWSGLCFAGLTLSNVLVVVDLAVVPEFSMYAWRLAVAAVSLLLLLYGLIFESD
jgi:fluoride ion exporter CrcB/FEX